MDLDLSNEGTPFSNAKIKLASNAEDTSVSVKALYEKPGNLPGLETIVYRYVEVKTSLKEEDIESAKIKFKVEKSWLEENKITADNVALFRYDNGWDRLSTSHESQDSSYSYYTSETSGFSYFAIAAKSNPVIEEPEKNETAPPLITGAAVEGITLDSFNQQFGLAIIGFALFLQMVRMLNKYQKQKKD